ncbi:hypothetical protein L486_06530 [Kwoniella mangroviensis CBS 10435]|uniref:Uncharacterized protein n=1 Tax=Kwoniella mangroviensis CBS 10435 TaxID=1331196 RepID=A0A1B9IJB8_9TREE|nr:uncharacterized protein I203_05227 [Kwoniella mangroviensis CBS 8507]OCF55778.1 hypothetical protein L486_06530 [Kwoniella mangroviensis CBS 10435]OCF65551.1 hypothetical protein I203_05227 [Kwoniella mangroviensis CBS 8507]
MRFSAPIALTFTLLTTLVASSPHAGDSKHGGLSLRGERPLARGAVGVYQRQTTGDADDSGDATTSDGDASGDGDDGSTSTDEGDGTDTTDGSDGSDTAAATPTYTYDGTGGEAGDSGPALTYTDPGTTPPSNDLTSATAANVEATSADPNAQPSSAPTTSSSHSGLTNYNTTTRSQTVSLVGTSAAQTSTRASGSSSASASQANSGAFPSTMPNISPLSLITVVLAGGLGVIRVLV